MLPAAAFLLGSRHSSTVSEWRAAMSPPFFSCGTTGSQCSQQPCLTEKPPDVPFPLFLECRKRAL
eukprot:11156347-Prorocentrum_lima.AAC.1